VRVVMAVGCVLVSAAAGCSQASPLSTPTTSESAPSAVEGPSIPGIGATRHDWDASHAPNGASEGHAYGHDPSLPEYVSVNGAVYSDVDDWGTGRIQWYSLNMHTVEGPEVLRRIRPELPSDATVAWDLRLPQCYHLAFNSATLEAAGHYMAEVQLEYIQEDGKKATNPDKFNVATFWLDDAGSPPNPASGCA
jgi:hypothetical protein